jgi:hypothetical protein
MGDKLVEEEAGWGVILGYCNKEFWRKIVMHMRNTIWFGVSLLKDGGAHNNVMYKLLRSFYWFDCFDACVCRA